MKQIQWIVCIMLFVATGCDAQQNNSITTEATKNTNKNILNEKWSNDERTASNSPVDTSWQWYNQMHQGTDCYFYNDSTFKIRLWWYGVNSGLFERIIPGKYQYNASTKEITLAFDDQYKGENMYSKPIPISYYVLKGLSEEGLPFWGTKDKELPVFTKTCLKIVGEPEKNRLKVNLYAYKKNGEKVSFGQVVYIRGDIDKEL